METTIKIMVISLWFCTSHSQEQALQHKKWHSISLAGSFTSRELKTQKRWQISLQWRIEQKVYDHSTRSVQFSRSLMSDSLWPHESQHTRPPCPSPTPRVYSKSCPSSRWCHPAISSSVIPFSSCPQSLPASGSFPLSQLFAWGGQSIGVSASASSNEHPGLISPRMDFRYS